MTSANTSKVELFGTKSCPHTREMREFLEWRRREFVEYDVESDPVAMQRFLTLVGDQRMVPVLIEDGKVVQIGWQGRGCVVDERPQRQAR